MSFKTFCNICFIKKNIIKLCGEENERIINILVSFTSSPDVVNGIIYLCTSCCDKLEEYDKFRELLLTNFVRFRYLYNEHKKQLEIRNAADIETLLKAFVDVNVERPSGTPLIENYEIARSLRYNTTSDVDITCKDSDEKSFKIDLENLIQNDLMHIDTGLHSEINISDNETEAYQVKNENDSFNEAQENTHETTGITNEPIDEASQELTITDNGATSISCPSSANKENCNLSNDEEINLEKGETNPERFDKSNDPVMSDTVANVSPRRELEDDDNSEVSFNPEDNETDDTTDEEDFPYQISKKRRIDVKCNICGKRFPFRCSLKKHMLTHTGERPFQCDQCEKSFSHKCNLKQHKRTHSGEKPYKCEECGMGFRQHPHLMTHRRRHTGDRPYTCDQCDKSFAKNFTLIKHKLVHNREKPYKCDDCCINSTKDSKEVNGKLKNNSKKLFHCAMCQKYFMHTPCFVQHKETHNFDKPKTSKEKRRHITDRLYLCDQCPKVFNNSAGLRKHRRSHCAVKPYKCDECGAGFLEKCVLTNHIRTHTGERPFSCDQCQRSFTVKFNLTKHQRKHTAQQNQT